MKKNGFTLVELLAVIVIMILIMTMGSAGIGVLKEGINKSIWNNTVDLIENGAKRFCDDKKTQIMDLDPTSNKCVINSKNYAPCLTVTVDDLLMKKYISTKEYNEDKKVIINKTIEKGETGYYVNYAKVYIYVENDVCYATYIGL